MITDVEGVSFVQAIVLHACGFCLRRREWPEGQAVVGEECSLKVPRGALAILIPDWDPTPADMLARDWETAGRWRDVTPLDYYDVIDAEEAL